MSHVNKINLINRAKKAPEFKGLDTSRFNLVTAAFITKGSAKEMVGVMFPSITSYKGKLYTRSGAIYIEPQYRRLGYARKALTELFAKKAGFAVIERSNVASIKTFESLGFTKVAIAKSTPDADIYLREVEK